VAVEQQGAATASTFPGGDDVRAALIASFHRDVAGMFLERFPIGLPHIDVKAELLKIVR
jgi:hypothetical protein